MERLDFATATPVAFVYVIDRARGLAFYQDTLGLKHREADEYGDYLALNGASLRMTVIPDHKPSAHPVVGWTVPDIEATARALLERGVAFTRFPGMPQDDLGIWTSPDGKSKIAFFNDPDGNVLSVSQG